MATELHLIPYDPAERTLDIITDPVQVAALARLRYVTDDGPGIQRQKKGDKFIYLDVDGKRVKDEKTLDRIKALGIPPAWTDVWICPKPNGHIQATGRDAKGRKQYRYHARWRDTRNENKFGRMVAFGKALPAIRECIEHDLKLPNLPREKVLALVVRLLETTFIRVGNEEYARKNRSFGLTTMRDRHVDVSGSTVEFRFRGKSGKDHTITVKDKRLAKLVRRCKDIPGQELFQYIDEDGHHQSIGSAEVNDYLREISGQDFTAKDFRTWGGTVLSVLAFQELGAFETETQAKKNITQAIREVSKKLGNTPAICCKYYLHPAIIDAYRDNSLLQVLQTQTDQPDEVPPYGLRLEEQVVMTVLEHVTAQTD